jgi:phage terminase Nu1 subunit (DNA packaging protein)
MKITTTLALFAATLASAVTFAQTATPVVNERQQNEAARINQGVASGELTKGEARTLRTEQRGIQAEKKAFKADGKVTAAERAQLRRDQNIASKRIYKKKHNAKKAA